jgi:hypothetical protein
MRTGTIVWSLVCAAWVVFIWLWSPAYLTLTVDDSFYVFRTAENIATGHGVTFDQINPTNGFHPLWMVAAVPLVMLGGGDASRVARIALSAEVLFVWLALMMLARARQRSAILFVAAIVLTNFYSAKALFNGLESALQVLLIAAALIVGQRASERPVGDAWKVGALGGLAMLARLDAVFLALTLCAMPVLWPAGDPRQPFSARMRWSLIAFATLAVVVAPYFLYNQLAFGHLMPVSGAIKAGTPIPRGPLVKLGLPLACLAGLAVVGAWGRRNGGTFLRFVFPLVAYIALETAYNARVRGVLVPEIWYLAPHLLLAILVASEAVAWSRGRPRAAWALGAIAMMFLTGTAVAWRTRLDPSTYSSYLGARQAGEWLARNTDPDAVIAGWDCGIAAAHARRRYMNLDGLINSWRYKEQFLDRGRVYDFITSAQPADYVCQWVSLGTFDGRTIHGIDFRGWNVVYHDTRVFRSILSPWRTRTDVYLILTRRPGGVPFETFGPALAAHATPAR